MGVYLDLNKFKASGIYTFEYDRSEMPTTTNQVARLIVGFSRKGPFNSPVYLTSKKAAIEIFGDIDYKLEAKGSFFHRSLLTALDVGPVWALNLLPLNNDPFTGDKVSYQSFSLSPTEFNGVKTQRLLSSFYNKNAFWYPDQEYFIANVNSPGSRNAGKILNIVNLSQTPVSILIKKADSLKHFSKMTVKEFYKTREIPAYLNEDDFISDYFVDLYIIQGNWCDYKALSTHPVYHEYFTEGGIRKDKLRMFLSLPEVKVIRSFTGSIIPDLRDENDINYSIDTIVNAYTGTTGIFIAIDRDALNNYDPDFAEENGIGIVDMVGHTLAKTRDISKDNTQKETPDIINFLSYRFGIKNNYSFRIKNNFEETDYLQIPNSSFLSKFKFDSLYIGGDFGILNNSIIVEKPKESENDYSTHLMVYNTLKNLLIPNESILKTVDNKFATIRQVYEFSEDNKTYLRIVYSHPSKLNEINNKFNINNVEVVNNLTKIEVNTNENLQILIGQQVLLKNKQNEYFYARVVNFNQTESNLEIILDKNYQQITSTNKNNWNIYLTSGVIAKLPSSDDLNIFIKKPDLLIIDESKDIIRVYSNNKLFIYILENIIRTGDYIIIDNSNKFLNIKNNFDNNGIQCIDIELYNNKEIVYKSNGQIDGIKLFNRFTSLTANSFNNIITVNLSGNIDERDVFENLFEEIQINSNSWNPQKTTFTINTNLNDKFDIGDFVVSKTFDEYGNPKYKLTKIIQKVKQYNEINNNYEIKIIVNQPIMLLEESGNYKVVRFKSIDDYANTYNLFFLEGFKLTDYHLPDKTKTQLEKILSVLDRKNSNLFDMLIDRNVISFRYIVDTFSGVISPQMYPKTYLTNLAKERQKCLAIMNFPDMKEFENSNDPMFCDEPTLENPKQNLNTYYISTGGNLSLGPSFTFSLPDEANGSKFAGFFAPFLRIRENGKNIDIPPAAHVSNLFVMKFINGNPYSIVAGPRRGVISDPKLVGLSYDFLQKDRENLEPMGVNPIIKRKNIGFMIYANQMAYQKTKSAFNNLHVRDLLITLEENIEDLLENYIFEFNNAETRIEIKTRIESFLERVRTLGGIYNYQVIMDESNNTNEVINSNTAVVDIAIEPQMGIHKFINRIYVYGSGGIESMGFNVAV